MKTFWGIIEVIGIGLGGSMIFGMISIPWLDFTEYTLAPSLDLNPKLTWAVASLTVIMGLFVIGAFAQSRSKSERLKDMR